MHAQNGHISTSGLKSDVTIVFFGSDFLYDAKTLAICTHSRKVGLFMFANMHRLSGHFGLKWGSWGKIGNRWCDIYPNEFVLTFAGHSVPLPVLSKMDQ